jgi:hypothetical protein
VEGELAVAVGYYRFFFSCRPVGIFQTVCVYTNNSIKINKNGKKLRGFNDDMSHLTGTPRIAKDTGRHIGGTKPRLWITMTMSHWALLEQIRTHPSKQTLEDENETMAWCIMQTARKLGLETG